MLQNEEPFLLSTKGAFFKGRENREVVESILTHPRERSQSYSALGIPQLIFYDAEHQIQIMRKEGASRTVRPYLVQETNRNETGAFWDMQHTTGTRPESSS